MFVCPSIHSVRMCVSENLLQFLQLDHTWGPWSKVKPRLMHYDIGRGEAELPIFKLISVFHHLPSVSAKQFCASAHLGCTYEAGTS